jgi:plastocyanin
MNEDFRQRVFLPFLMPLGVIVGFFGFAFMLSRVLLAVPEMASTTIALGLAGYILAIAGVVSARKRITSRALAVGVTIGILGVVSAGVVAAAAGMREIEHAGPEEGAPAEGGPEASQEDPEAAEAAAPDEDQLSFTAVDIEFADAPSGTVPAGAKNVVLTNEGAATHNVTIPALGDTPVVEAAGGETATAQIDLEPGTYEFFCSVPGHEQLMTGEFTAE